jgi:hypothetical protein
MMAKRQNQDDEGSKEERKIDPDRSRRFVEEEPDNAMSIVKPGDDEAED